MTMTGNRLHELRDEAGLTQAELAARAGVSRQLVGAVEAGRHLPRVDAALRLAAALGTDVPALFAPRTAPVDAVSGAPARDGTLVRAGRVGDRTVTTPVRIGLDGWDAADGVVAGSELDLFDRLAPGLVVAGCEPALELLERLLRGSRLRALAVGASSESAIRALALGRLHAAVVHGPESEAPVPPSGIEVERIHLARWRVGLAAAADAAPEWWRVALSGRVPVVQREPGAAAQRSFERAVDPDAGPVPGPRAIGHLDAARRAVLTGAPAVTIEPAALALGAAFHPLETHTSELWVARRWSGDRGVAAALDVISGRAFRSRLEAVGGYDLAECGVAVP